MLMIQNNMVSLGSKTIGRMDSNALLMKRNAKIHFYRVLNSWNLNIEVVNCGATRFFIDSMPDNKRYVITFAKIKELRAKLNMFVTFGDERQLAIPLECWDKYARQGDVCTEFPESIGISAEEFADTATGRWRSRLIAFGQMEIQL